MKTEESLKNCRRKKGGFRFTNHADIVDVNEGKKRVMRRSSFQVLI